MGFGVERSHFVIRCWPFVLRSVKTYTLRKIVIDSVPMRILPQTTSSCTAMVRKGIQKGLKEWDSERELLAKVKGYAYTHTPTHTITTATTSRSNK